VAAGAVLLGGLLGGLPAGADPNGPFGPVGPDSTEDSTTTTEQSETTEGSTSTTETEPGSSTTPSTTGSDGAATDAERGGATGNGKQPGGDDGGTSGAALLGAAVGGVVLGLLLAGIPLGLALASRKRSAPTAGPRPSDTSQLSPSATGPPARPDGAGPVIGPAPSRAETQVKSERAGLIDAVIALRDQLPSAALGEEAARALTAAGVTELSPDGVAFDPAQHRAVDQVATDDPARHNTVATVERPGYADGSRLIRLPEVVVARHGGQP